MYTYFIWCDHVTSDDPFDDFDVFLLELLAFGGNVVSLVTVRCLFSCGMSYYYVCGLCVFPSSHKE